MKIEDFGFQPVMGKEYVVSFSKDGELLSSSVYNGAPLPPVAFPDNSKISLTITDKETGKQLMSSDFISYNGKLYKSKFSLPLKNPDTNKNANIYIKELHYDLTTGSVLVQVQGFKGDNYKLLVSDTTLKHKVMAMPITLEDNMFYSIPTELVQGNTFEVLLQDQHGKSIDTQEFTAPISTDWRYTDTVEDGTLELDENTATEEQVPQQPVPGQDQTQTGQQQTQEQTTLQSLLPDAALPYEKEIVYGGGGLIILLILILVIRAAKRRKAKKAWTEEDREEYDEDQEEFEEVDGEYPDLDGKEENREEFQDEDEFDPKNQR